MNKDSKYGEDVCRYYDDGYYYVKPCEKGKYCVDPSSTPNSYLYICQDLPKIKHLSRFQESCKTSYECEGNLKCSDTCTYNSCNLLNEFIAYDPDNEAYFCPAKADQYTSEGYCYSQTYDSINDNFRKTYSPIPSDKNKICGKLTFDEIGGTNRGVFYVKSNEYAYKGTVQDGEYVDDMDLCQSGYALYFYYGGKSEDPRAVGASYPNQKYLRCVTPISVENSNGVCSVYYSLGGEEFVYKIGSYSTNQIYSKYCNQEFINIKSERIREYNQNITNEERDTCGDLEGKNKYTCENRELIKSWYFYQNPEQYILYNGREKLEKVLDHLIQMEYPSYYSISHFLNIQILLLILFLLF